MKGDKMKINNIKLNLLNNYCMFYEWLATDKINNYNSVYLFKVTSETLDDLINYQIVLNEPSLLENSYILLFSDGYSFIAIKFDDNNISQLKSSLILEEEIRLLNKVDELAPQKINYTKLQKNIDNNDLRINDEMRKTIHEEINSLINNNDFKKLEYIYYEWFNKMESNPTKIMKTVEKQLKRPIGKQESMIYDLIKMSYKMV